MKLSIIIPFYNEEGNVDFVLNEVAQVLKGMSVESEIIAVNDASRDATLALLKKAKQRIPQMQIVTHPHNYGQAAAFWTGFRAAQGDVVVTMDGDGQNDFHDVPKMLELLTTYDGVFGQRAQRKDPLSKLIATRIAFFFRRTLLKDTIRDTACALKVMKRGTLKYLLPFRGFHRFIPFMFEQAGLPYTPVDVNHRPRASGKSKYSLRKLYFIPTIMHLYFMWWYRRNNILKAKYRKGIRKE